jgi:hypothetical protein
MSQRPAYCYHRILGIMILTIICSRSLKIDFSKGHSVKTTYIVSQDRLTMMMHSLSLTESDLKIKQTHSKK